MRLDRPALQLCKFRLQFGDRAMSKEDSSALIRKLQDEKIVNLAVAAH